MGLVDNFDCKITHGVVVMPLVKQIYHNFSERREQMSEFFLLSHKPIGLLISPFFIGVAKIFITPDKIFFEPGRKNQGWHLLQESAIFGYFAFTTNQNNHGQK